jgi:hypothetical protein
MDVAPVLRLLDEFTVAARTLAPGLAILGFVTSALQLLLAHVVGSSRGQELAKVGMLGSVIGLVGVFFAPQIMAAVGAAFGAF